MNVKTLCLGVLSFGEASGYEIKKMVEEGRFSHFIEASYGSIYPALTQLSAEGLVTQRVEEQPGKPDKKVYAITPQGTAALSVWLSVLPADDKFKSEFLFQMLLLDSLPPEAVARSYEKQIAYLKGELLKIAECAEMAAGHRGAQLVNGYGRTVLSSGLAYMEEKKAEFLGGRVLKAAE